MIISLYVGDALGLHIRFRKTHSRIQ